MGTKVDFRELRSIAEIAKASNKTYDWLYEKIQTGKIEALQEAKGKKRFTCEQWVKDYFKKMESNMEPTGQEAGADHG